MDFKRLTEIYDGARISALAKWIKAHPIWNRSFELDKDTGNEIYQSECVVNGKHIALGFVITRDGKSAPDYSDNLLKCFDGLNESMAQMCAIIFLGLDQDRATETVAAAIYADNLRQLNTNNEERAKRFGYIATVFVDKPFAELDEPVRKIYLSYATAAMAVINGEKMDKDFEIPIRLTGVGAVGFNPVEHAELTPAQEKMMEPFAIALRHLKDGMGLRIMPPRFDFWLIAQMVRMLYNQDGTARTDVEQVVDAQFGR